jgi:putative ATP-binding cassette transporter
VDGLLKSLSTGWRIAVPYFRSEDHRKGRLLLIAVVAVQLCVVVTTVLLNRWYNGFYGALQDRNWDAFLLQIGYFFAIAISGTLLNVYLLYLNQWLEIRWRSWMTQFYVDHWLSSAKHYRMQLMGDPADNPDQRIAEDIKLFIERTLTICVGFVGALATIASFVVILWELSE